ncbi:uncharacterized protein N7496_009373 [Penicillium cataractarum]|uniref:Aminoglycoside phosphotransferase domain-containing protein n=1 Tax=Penicillium cataractarum TaxID=2100454 RepID=A0A9W9RQ85_9EURO|nr:uncharacterized protein N7496_009373 [Penicillium cataractarum]KAJ5363660.1 hypothetical protein N7496_009373 [Penicillium cataractarum]
MHPVMSFDDAAWVKSEQIVDNWIYQFCRPEIGAAAAQTLLDYHNSGEPVDFTLIGKGSYNISFRMEFENAPSAVIRYPLPATLRFPDEKIRNEAAVMRYVREHTSIPIPRVIYQGNADESQLCLGPFVIMEYVPHNSTMYALLNPPERPANLRGVLNPDISEDRLETLYRELADILLKMSMSSFPRIGSLKQKDDSTWEVAHRPLTLNMEQMVVMGTLPPEYLPGPDVTFETSASYLESVAETFIQHLNHQRNDSIESADDCRRKFVARRLFQKLAREQKLTNHPLTNGPFKLWCDDFRPANVIMDLGDHIVSVLDWEFSYSAPVEFTYAPPWWLLVEKPEYWPEGLEAWTRVYERRLKTFLGAMIKCEDARIDRGEMSDAQRLSGHMKKSWESGDFWITYAVTHSFAFDAIYWQKIDPRFFGPSNDHETAWKERLVLLSAEDCAEMERLVARKVGESKNKQLAWDCDEYTRFLSDRLAHAQIDLSGADDEIGEKNAKDGAKEAESYDDSEVLEATSNEVTNGPTQHSLESAHSMAIFQAIIDFSADRHPLANIEAGSTQKVDVAIPQTKEEYIHVANLSPKDAQDALETQVLSEKLVG